MAGGTIYLHPVHDRKVGIGQMSLWGGPSSAKIHYVVPGVRIVRAWQQRLTELSLPPEVRIEVQTFDQWVRRLLSHSSVRLMTSVEQGLIIQQAVEQVGQAQGYRYFHEAQERAGWLERMEFFIGEMKRSGLRPTRMEHMWQDKGEKYQELAAIYRAYHDQLAQHDCWDHEEPYFALIEQVKAGEIELPTRVVLEHFNDIYPLQEQLLIQLVTAGVQVNVHLVADPKRPQLFAQTWRTVEKLQQRGFYVEQIQLDEEQRVPKQSALIQLDEQLFRSHPTQCERNDGAVQIIQGTSVKQEVEQQVAHVKRWLRESGASLAEVALVLTDRQRYESPLRHALEEAGLPLVESERVVLHFHPWMQMILYALRAATGEQRAWGRLLESPYLPWAHAESRSQWQQWKSDFTQISGRSQWDETLTAIERQSEMESEFLALELLRRVGEWVYEVPELATKSDWLTWFHTWLTAVRPQLSAVELKDQKRMRLRLEEMNAWQSLMEVTKQWQSFIRESQQDGKSEQMEVIDFIRLLERMTERVEVERRPGRRGGVRLLSPNQLQAESYRLVCLFGCVEGSWPRPYRDDWLVPDQERLRLRDEGVWLSTSDELRSKQAYPFFTSVNAAQEKLLLSYSAYTGAGREQLPSLFVEEVENVVGRIRDSLARTEESHLLPISWESALTPHRGLERAISLLAHAPSSAESHAVQMSRDMLEEMRRRAPKWMRRVEERIQIERARERGQAPAFAGVLQPYAHESLFDARGQERVWSASMLNELARCRFRFLLSRGMGLLSSPEMGEGLTALARGEVIHRMLCRFWNAYREHALTQCERERALERLEAVMDSTWIEAMEYYHLDPDGMEAQIEWGRVRQRVRTMVEHDLAWREEEINVRPRYLEWSFGQAVEEEKVKRGEVDPASLSMPVQVPLTAHFSILLRGKVDRVDVDRDGFYTIFDYKSGSAPDNEEIVKGMDVQLPLYLRAVQAGFQLSDEQAVGAAFFEGARMKAGKPPTHIRNKGIWRKEDASRFGISERVRTLMAIEAREQVLEQVGRHVQTQIEKSEQGDYAVQPHGACPTYCPFQTVCRVRLEHGRGE
ncbi:PD-(D/E)XK nuclease family protein [Mechercharimyces sp. CAU 1602]|uniref:PD-(D/E)XK nuclease family protein n=1 Tax=Mechercharimyces sp. CAU 1602 TaxID=2973933 RepID=UPI002161A60E|nr:PD-(D/E)XK nuclease family protein [Mechercharimyces sp. CAU 1602]MCS1350238.1 PD-(D/E)XK nuclease family protein [Mechercharimyces sp. CAU 1602]